MSRAVKIAKLQARGDPGLFGFLGGIAKKATGFVSKLGIPGVSQVAGIAHGVLPGNGSRTPQPMSTPSAPVAPYVNYGGPSPMGQQPFAPGVMTPGIGGRVNIPLPGGRQLSAGTGVQLMGPRGAAQVPMPVPAQQVAGMMRPAGYHLNKTGYFLQDGTYVAPFTKWVKNRRRNPLNPRALDRACGRVSSAQKATKWIHRSTVPRKPTKRRKKC